MVCNTGCSVTIKPLILTMKLLLKPLQWLYCIYALLVFILTMLPVIPCVLIGLFYGKIIGGNFIYKVCKYWGFVWYFMVGIRQRIIYEAPHDASKQYIFVANHISYLDIPPAFTSFNQPLRVLGKIEMAKVPVFGFIYKNTAVLVDRSSPMARAKSVRILKSYLRKHISIFLFPEGTFNITGKPLKPFFDGAFRMAIETQTPVKPVLFVDTLDRLHYRSLFSLTPGICRSVFLEEIPVAGLTANDIQTLKQQVFDSMEVGMRKYRKYDLAN